MLHLNQVHKRFGDVRAVDGVSLRIEEGQMVGVIGRSGAGKSTLLRLINRLIDANEGQITFNGMDIRALKGPQLRAWRTRCAMIFQQFNLVNRLNVVTNVLIGRLNYNGAAPTLLNLFPRRDRALAIRALERLDMAPFALQRAETLSGGQQQRVAIARALVQEPRILLADEPIASLDLHNATRVMEALRSINREDGITVICNLHHLDTARHYCDRIVGMAKGQIRFDGAPEALTPEQMRDIYAVDGEDEELEQALAQSRLGAPRDLMSTSASAPDAG